MIIDSVKLENFRSHKDTLFKLHPRINVIVGQSDSGKSAFLKGLYWAIENRPTGLSSVRNEIKEKGKIKPKEQSSVTVTKVNGETLTRLRSSGTNGYLVNGVEASAIGTDVPQEVQNFFNLSEVNIQKQHERSFLIFNTPGETARFFNKTVDLEVIDQVLSKAEGQKRKTVQAIKQTEAQIVELERALEQFDWLPEAQEQLNKLEVLSERCERAKLQYKELNEHLIIHNNLKEQTAKYNNLDETKTQLLEAKELRNELSMIQSKFNSASNSIEGHQKSFKIVTLYKGMGEVDKSLKELKQLLKEMQALEQELKALRTLIRAREAIKIVEVPEGLKDLVETVKINLQRKQRIEDSADDLDGLLLSLNRNLMLIEQAETTYRELITKRPETCPLCGGAYGDKECAR